MYWNREVKIAGSFKKELDKFPLYHQETDHTCGPASARMVLKYFGEDIPEKEIAKRCKTFSFGTLHWTFTKGYRYYLNKIGKTVNMVEDSPEIYDKIKSEIENNNPVVFLFATIDEFHPPKKTLHYAVIIGIDETEKKITVANPFGRIEKMDIEDWWERFSLNPKHITFQYRLFIKLRLLKPRTAFIVSNM